MIRLRQTIDHKKQGPGNKGVNDEFPEIISIGYSIVGTVKERPKLFFLNIEGLFGSDPKNDVEYGPEDQYINEEFLYSI
jgi:hypothetical protein